MTQLRLGMGGHHSPVAETDEWLTPPDLLAKLGSFDLDPCAPVQRPWPTAAQHYTIEDNGLRKPWEGTVWLNPPYGRPEIVAPWMRRMAAHNNGVALIFARTETDMFFETVWSKAAVLLFIRGRLHFHVARDTTFERKGASPIFVRAGGRAPANAGAPSVLVAYGEANIVRLHSCDNLGHLVQP